MYIIIIPLHCRRSGLMKLTPIPSRKRRGAEEKRLKICLTTSLRHLDHLDPHALPRNFPVRYNSKRTVFSSLFFPSLSLSLSSIFLPSFFFFFLSQLPSENIATGEGWGKCFCESLRAVYPTRDSVAICGITAACKCAVDTGCHMQVFSVRYASVCAFGAGVRHVGRPVASSWKIPWSKCAFCCWVSVSCFLRIIDSDFTCDIDCIFLVFFL